MDESSWEKALNIDDDRESTEGSKETTFFIIAEAMIQSKRKYQYSTQNLDW